MLIDFNSTPNIRSSQRFAFLLATNKGMDIGVLSPAPTQIFQIPWLITMSIAATRMYRRLEDFLSLNRYDDDIFFPSLYSLFVVKG